MGGSHSRYVIDRLHVPWKKRKENTARRSKAELNINLYDLHIHSVEAIAPSYDL